MNLFSSTFAFRRQGALLLLLLAAALAEFWPAAARPSPAEPAGVELADEPGAAPGEEVFPLLLTSTPFPRIVPLFSGGYFSFTAFLAQRHRLLAVKLRQRHSLFFSTLPFFLLRKTGIAHPAACEEGFL